MVLDNFKKHQKKAVAEQNKKKAEQQAADKKKQEKQRKREEEYRKQSSQPTIKELTDEEAAELEKELKKVNFIIHNLKSPLYFIPVYQRNKFIYLV